MLVCDHCGGRHEEKHHYCPITGKLLAPERFFPPGTLLDGKYCLDEALGSGTIAAVFAATHTLLNKRVAIKVMLPVVSQDRDKAARMAREARAASAVGHPNIAAVTDMGFSDKGAMYVVMELLRGRTLTAVVRDEGRMPAERAVELTRELLSALEAAHGLGIVHRDIKPDNLMLAEIDGQQRLKLLDFGISKCLHDETLRQSLTATGSILGTPYFMAPEQARGATDLDHRADLYAVGGVLYWLLTGRRPLDAEDYDTMLTTIIEGSIVSPAQHASIPAGLDAIVLRALARQPADRFEDAAAMRSALEPFTATPEAPPDADAPGGPAAVLDNIGVGSLVGLDQRHDAPPEPKEAEPEAKDPEPGPPEPNTEAAPRGDAEPAPDGAPADDDPFAPPDERHEGPLELERAPLPAPLEVGAAPQGVPLDEEAEGGTVHDPGAGRHRRSLAKARALLTALGGAAVAVVAIFVVFSFVCEDDPVTTAKRLAGPSQPSDVLILVETVPKGALIYVDGVRQVSGSIRLPRSGRAFTIRVEKRGYVGQSLELAATQTRAIRVELRPKPKRFE